MAVRRVDDDHIDLGRDEGGGALERVRPDSDGGPDPQSPPLVLGGERVALTLLDVLDRDQAAQAPGRVDDRKLLDLVATEQQLWPSASVVPTGAVIRLSLVISSRVRCSGRAPNRRSRFVRIPTSTPSGLVIGTPETR